MKYKNLLRALSLLLLLTSFVPLNHSVHAAPALPPVDMFQLPWEQGLAWVALDGFDNGSDRAPGSSHNYSLGGAIDFAPHNNMIRGENTSNFWVTAAAAGTVYEMSKCHLKIVHSNGWITEYQHLANFQVKLGDVVAQNQKLAVIANALSQPVCVGSEPPDIPHLHFSVRPNMVGATFAGWEFRYNWFWNNTTFRKGGITLGLFKPLLNVLDAPPTSTPTPTTAPSSTPTVIPTTSTPVNLPTATSTPPSGPYVSTTVNLPNINVGETALATVNLNNVPAEGYTSAEFTCTYNASLVEVSNIVIANLFGADSATAIHAPQIGSFIVAIAGSNGNKATTSGAVFTFDVEGLQAGQTALECTARVSKGDNVLTDLPSIGTDLTILGAGATPVTTQSPAPATPTPQPSVCDKAEFVADVTTPPGTVVLPGDIHAKGWRLKNVGTCVWTPAYAWTFVGGDQMDAGLSNTLADNVFPGQEVEVFVSFVAPRVSGHYQSFWKLRNASGVLFGGGDSASDPFLLDIVASGPTVTPTVSPGPTGHPDGWLTFTNLTYGFEFKYPPGSQVVVGEPDNYARIDLPFVQGTNLREKYLEVIVQENSNLCESPLATQSGPETSETVIINGISFLKQTGSDAGAGHLHEWIAYSTFRGNICVSLDFILHSLNAGNFPTPPPVFDFAAESAVFGQIVETYTWLALLPTATPTFTPVESPTPTFTFTPVVSPTSVTPPAATPTLTPTASPTGMISGQVIASKPVTISVYGADNALIVSVQASLDNSFAVTLSGGTYTVVASASGFLNTQGSFSVTSNLTTTLPTITLQAGDIDGNNVIDQFDALTIGMSYNTSAPASADLNNDGIINVLDLELLAKSYRMTGPIVWE